MATTDLWGESFELVSPGYDPGPAATMVDDLVFALATIGRRMASLERRRIHADAIQAALTSQLATLSAEPPAAPVGPAPSADEDPRARMAEGALAQVDRILAPLIAAGASRELVERLRHDILFDIKRALHGAGPLDVGPTASPAVDDVVEPAPVAPAAPSPVPTTQSVPSAPAQLAIANDHRFAGRLTLRLAPLSGVAQLRQAQEMLAQFTDALTVHDVIPSDDGSSVDFVVDVGRPSPLLVRFSRFAGVTASADTADRIDIRLTPIAPPSPLSGFSGRLGGANASPHG